MVFQDIREKSDLEARAKDFSTNESKKLDNRRLNRYRDVLPYDHSRVALKRGDTDYINANLVKMEHTGRKYILCQGPLPHTVGHFWMMVWEHDSRAILMLNKLIEKTTVKCHQYWPGKIGEKNRLELSAVQLSVVYLKCVEYKNFCKRTFRLTDLESGKSREVIQFHYTTWPDFGIPSSPVAFLQFLKEVRDSGTLDRDVGPPIIHCSAGIGRSGTFCLVDCCLVLIDKEGEDRVSVQNVLLELRQYRMGLIQTPDQLYFSYQAIIEGMKRMNNSSFEEFEELSIVSSTSQPTSDQDTENEDTPPPLPPPRSHSLTIGTKPLPVIPMSESVHEDFLLSNSERDKVNNLVNLEKSKQYEISDENHHHHNNHHARGKNNGNHHHHQRHHHHQHNNTNRPLPPLPKESSLDKVNEADDGGEDSERSDSRPVARHYSSSSNNSSGGEDELIEEIGSSDEDDDDDDDVGSEGGANVPSDNSDNIKSSVLDESCSSKAVGNRNAHSTGSSNTTSTSTTAAGGGTSSSSSTTATTTSSSSTGLSSSTSVSSATSAGTGSNSSTLESNRGDKSSAFNANSTLPPLPNGALDDDEEMISSPERELSPSAELRRRKRAERHTAMEEKIREIKRKQKEVENKGSPKKRRKQKESEK
ncbi:tyrosine-protein phosphatase non-receptor type 61F-like [Anopheles cruzii]|uniref:tyrosine-protein phosphatase non-receptor type 61F-like n=1 Tax=Anopheles cruzii TaxID=68878 RepID=UPI0022EC5EDB|nr:tyrosine-protein phosphatase non-receptor type 61F-like [Anopheles cruzii]